LFDDLFSVTKLGRIPTEIFVDIEGMEIEWLGRKKWDNKAFPRLSVNSVQFGVPLVPCFEKEGAKRRPSENELPATRLQVDQLMQRLDSRWSEIEKILKYLFLMVVIVFGLLFFPRW
jgi:hypothetical protein